MHGHDRVPVFRLHFKKALVSEDTGVVDDDINLAEGFHGGLDDIFTALGRGHVVVIGNRLTAGFLDLLYHLVGCRRRPLAGTVPRATQIVDHHLGTAAGQFQGVSPSQAAAGTGDDGYPVVKPDLILGNITVFKNTQVDDGITGFGIDHAPVGQAFPFLPDLQLNGVTRHERTGKPIGHATGFFRLAGDQVLDQHPAGKPVGAQSMKDRF